MVELAVVESTEMGYQQRIHIILPGYLWKNLECLNISNYDFNTSGLLIIAGKVNETVAKVSASR